MANATLKLGPSFLEQVVAQAIGTNNLRLGVITLGNQVAEDLIETTPATIINAEYNASGWLRPSLSLANNGSYDANTDKWGIPTSTTWSITGPTGGIDIKQCFIILGGNTTPRNATGILVGICTYTTAIAVPAATTINLTFNANFFGTN